MRASTTLNLVLALGASSAVLASSPVPEGGSIQALLERQASRTHRGIPVDTLPSFLKPDNISGDVTSKNTTVIVLPQIPAKSNETVASAETASATKLVKRTKPKKEQKRWVWATEIIQDSTPTDGLPPVGQNANLLSGSAGAYPVNTPTGQPVAPTFAPVPTTEQKAAIVILSSIPPELRMPSASSSASAAPSSSSVVRKVKGGVKAHQRRAQSFSHDNRKRWMWHPSADNEAEDSTADEDLQDQLFSSLASAKPRSTSASSSALASSSSAAAGKPAAKVAAASYFDEEDAYDEEDEVEEEESSTVKSSSTKARAHYHATTASPVSLPYRLAQLQRSSSTPSAESSEATSTSTRRRQRVSSSRANDEESTSTSMAHRRVRPSSTMSTSQNSTSTSHRRSRPTPSTSAQPLIHQQQARVAKLQISTILASRMQRAAVRGQPTDTIAAPASEQDEEEFEFEEDDE